MGQRINNKLSYGNGKANTKPSTAPTTTPTTTPKETVYNSIFFGDRGDQVLELQKALGFTGSDLDGIFGKKTQQAVMDFQDLNGLTVDGVANQETQSALFGNSAATPNSGGTTGGSTGGNATGGGTTANKPESDKNTAGNTTGSTTTPSGAKPVISPGGVTYGDFYYPEFTESAIVTEAKNLLQQHLSNKPGEYVPTWQDEADAYLSQYQGRDPFSYDVNSDALYNQYKDQYIQQGRMAMMDTMGQAAAMTGGYGNSYAQTVGQQAYNQQLGQLNEVMPELYGMAFDRYNQEGQDLLNMYDLYMGREADEYGRYQDNLNNWYANLEYLTDDYNTKYDRNWNEYLEKKNTAWNEYATDRSENFSIAEREAAALKAAGDSPYGTLNTADTMTWIKKFEGAENLKQLESYTMALQGIIGPEAAAAWYDIYAEKFLNGKDSSVPGSLAVSNTEGNRITY